MLALGGSDSWGDKIGIWLRLLLLIFSFALALCCFHRSEGRIDILRMLVIEIFLLITRDLQLRPVNVRTKEVAKAFLWLHVKYCSPLSTNF